MAATTTLLLLLVIAGTSLAQQRSLTSSSSNSAHRRNRLPAGKSEVLGFSCPEDFGYYQHPTECTQYYVCVFGGALLESCSGGLVYSHDLQTCDWPRNVVCNLDLSAPVSTVRVTDPRTAEPPGARGSTQSLTPSVGSSHSFSNSIRSSNSRNKDHFSGSPSAVNRQGRIIQNQEIGPAQQAIRGRFQVQESTNRAFSIAPTTSRSLSFPPPPAPPALDDAYYSELLNLTDAEYYYLYEDLLDDYFDTAVAATTTPRPAPTRAPARTNNRNTAETSRPSRLTLKPASEFVKQGSHLITNVLQFPARRPAPVYPQPPYNVKATTCDPKVCKLPDCNCGGKSVPGGIAPQNVPQMVLLTFDDSVNDLNKELYKELFERGRTNPNGCPIAATFYVSHEWTDYSQVQNLYADGHEIASHSITHSFGEQFSKKKWAKEIGGQREIMAAYAAVKMEDIRGMRAPFLAVGGNKMFDMLYEQNFTYDSSMPVYENRPPSWPYTFDYKVFHDCMIPPCPTNSFPGVWEVPMVMWQDLNGGRCSMGDACTTPPDAEGVYKMLIKNFERHYTTNRAPMGLFYHAAWFTTAHHKEGFIAFLDTIASMQDVWLVTNWQALQWVRDPVPMSQLSNYKPLQCNYPDRPKRCKSHRVCNVWHKGGVRYMRTCQRCPEAYPWVGNTGVQSPLNNS